MTGLQKCQKKFLTCTKSLRGRVEFERYARGVLHFLENYAIAHGSAIPMVLGAALPLTASLLGPGSGTRLLACLLGPVNLYILNVCAVAGGKTATHQSVVNEAIAAIEDDPNSTNLLLENYRIISLSRRVVGSLPRKKEGDFATVA